MTARAGSAAAVLGAAAARTAARADHERRLRGAGLLPGRRDRTELELLTRPRLLRGEDQLPPPPPPPPPPQRHRDLPTPGSSGSLSSSSTATTRSSTMDLSFMAAQTKRFRAETAAHCVFVQSLSQWALIQSWDLKALRETQTIVITDKTRPFPAPSQTV
nr:uncharacterized protein C14orf132 homolog isoform X2 [Caretta caretta]